jgi:AcrR family transcriptional regulator
MQRLTQSHICTFNMKPAYRPPAPANQTDDLSRKTLILRAAERLFAQHGFHGVAIRKIAEEVGVPLALVGYYFGSKQALYHAVFLSRKDYIDQRLAALAIVREHPMRRGALEQLVTAFVEPVLRLTEDKDGRLFLKLVGRGVADGHPEAAEILAALYDPLAHAFIDALTEVLPGIDRGTAAWCYQFALGALMANATSARIERLSRGKNKAFDVATAGPLLIRFITQGIRGVYQAEHKKKSV